MYLFYKNIMHIIILNMILICGICAHYNPDSNSLNVGSVLFNRNNLNKSLWFKHEIELLQARKHFQSVLPAPRDIKTINEDCLNNILTYFNNSYTTIKREVKNHHLQNIMNIALSDVFGGYLKVWILPITKYAYYGGSVSAVKAVETFQFYDKIKESLNTDGHSWRSPNQNLLRSVTIDVISRPRTTFTRSMGDPCKPLSFFEKCNAAFKIPMPIVNWNIKPPSLVLPLKNKSCIPLSSPGSSHIMLQYFDIAENCMKSQNVQYWDEFKDRFQIWLSSDVVPHLNDDSLYLAFGNVLTLYNKTKGLSNIISTNYKSKYKKMKCKASEMKSHGQTLLKKYFIVGIILLIEIIWCVPSLFYIIRFKKKGRFQRAKEQFCRFFKRNPTYSLHSYSQFGYDGKNLERYDSGIKLFFKRNQQNLDSPFSINGSELLSNSHVRHKEVSREKVSLINEVPKKSSSKKQYKAACISAQEIFNDNIKPKTTRDVLTSTSILKKQNKKSESFVDHKMSILSNEQTVKEVNYSQVLFSTQSSSLLDCICCKTNNNISKSAEFPCPCINCVNMNNEECKPVIDKKLRSKYFKFKQNDNKKKCKSIMTLNGNQKSLQTKIKKNIRIFEGSHLHINSKKTTVVKEEITNIKEEAGSSRKPSRIPRLKIKYNIKEVDKNIVKCEPCLPKTKSILRKNSSQNDKVLDDSAIKRMSGVPKKLNVSL